MQILQFYEFREIPNKKLEFFKSWFYENCLKLNLKGLILLAPEGINLSISGHKEEINIFLENCYKDPFFLNKNTRIRFQHTEVIPYKKLIVKIKEQIIPFPFKIRYELNQDYFISPKKFHQLMEENKVIPVDTRNYYEWSIGSFRNSIKFPIRTFRELPSYLDWFKKYYFENEDKIFVSFCTGGIRCEKVVPFFVEKGFCLYQIEGGILDYFLMFGNQKNFWEGECFVFDERYSILPNFKKGNTIPCNLCGQPVVDSQCVRCGKISVA
ncbi:MAG: rhodanese-like domain-containing protein [Leptonema sp. (in: bacteria)]